MSFNFPEIEANVISIREENDAHAQNLDVKNIDATMTVDRDLNIDVCDADRTLTFKGDVTTGGDLTTGGTLNTSNNFTTTTGDVTLNADAAGSNVTLPMSGTLLNETEICEKIDTAIQGLDVKESVRLTTKTDLSATDGTGYMYAPAGGASTNGQITWTTGPTDIDGRTPAVGDRILVQGNTNPIENGIWVITSATVWDRAVDFDGVNNDVTPNAYTWVEDGDSCGDQGYVLTSPENNPVDIGTDSLVFTQFTGAGQITAGMGIVKSANTLSADLGDGLTFSGNKIIADLEPQGGIQFTTSEAADEQHLELNLSHSSIEGTLAVGNGGTGQSTLMSGNVLVGNGTGAVAAGAVNADIVTQTVAGVTNAVPKYTGAGKVLTPSNILVDGSDNVTGAANISFSGDLQSTTGVFDITDGTDEILRLSGTAGADNEITVSNATTGNAPAICATGDDANVTLDVKAKGTGDLNLTGNNVNAVSNLVNVGAGTVAAEVRLQDADGSDYVGIKAHDTTSSYTVTMPDMQGAINQALVNDGSGNLSWQNFAAANSRHFQVSSIEIAINNTASPKNVVYFPWNDALYGGATSMTVTVYATEGSASASTLTVSSNTAATATLNLGSGGASGIFTITSAPAVPTGDDLLTFAVRKTAPSGTHPRIFAITIDLA